MFSHEAINRCLAGTYINCTSSTLFAGSKVNVLINRHDANHVALRLKCLWMKETPSITGKNEATMKRTVKTSR